VAARRGLAEVGLEVDPTPGRGLCRLMSNIIAGLKRKGFSAT